MVGAFILSSIIYHFSNTIFLSGTKLLFNVRLNQYVSIAKQGDKMIRILCVNYADPVLGTTTSDAQLQSYLIKIKTTQVKVSSLCCNRAYFFNEVFNCNFLQEFEDLFTLMQESIETAKKQNHTVTSSTSATEESTSSASTSEDISSLAQ